MKLSHSFQIAFNPKSIYKQVGDMVGVDQLAKILKQDIETPIDILIQAVAKECFKNRFKISMVEVKIKVREDKNDRAKRNLMDSYNLPRGERI